MGILSLSPAHCPPTVPLSPSWHSYETGVGWGLGELTPISHTFPHVFCVVRIASYAMRTQPMLPLCFPPSSTPTPG